MPINVNNREADVLTRTFAQPKGVEITDAIIVAIREAIERRRGAETPLRPDKCALSVEAIEPIILEFLDERGIEILYLPPAMETARLAVSAAHRYRAGRHGLNLGDCLHYACAKVYGVPILQTDDEFRRTDLETIA